MVKIKELNKGDILRMDVVVCEVLLEGLPRVYLGLGLSNGIRTFQEQLEEGNAELVKQ